MKCLKNVLPEENTEVGRVGLNKSGTLYLYTEERERNASAFEPQRWRN